MNYQDYFKGKKIVLMGLGVLGRGVNVAKFLAECGAEPRVSDTKTKEALQESVDKLAQFPNIKYCFGGHDEEDLVGADMLIKAAGVPFDSPYLLEAQRRNIPIKMDASLFCELMPEGVITVGVTGTRGKTTTTQLIYHILKECLGLNSSPQGAVGRKTLLGKVFLGGNIRGLATLPLLKEVRSGDVVVMELDSWQLQGFGDAGISPHIAVFTNFYPDHQNYYRNDLLHYFNDKANIYRNQKECDTLIVGEEVLDKVALSNPPVTPLIARVGDVPSEWKPMILGEHNRANIACAVLVASALGVSEDVTREAVESFGGVEGRLEYLRSVNGVKIYNDNNATTAEATVAALRALSHPTPTLPSGRGGSPRNTILIMGGSDKGLDMSELVSEIGVHCKAVVLLDETGTRRIGKDIEALHSVTVIWCDGLSACLSKAMQLASDGDIVLFSPAFASFGKWFKNEYDRNDQFVALVKAL